MRSFPFLSFVVVATAGVAAEPTPAARSRAAGLSGAALQRVVTDSQKAADAIKQNAVPAAAAATPFQPPTAPLAVVAQVPAVVTPASRIFTEVAPGKSEAIMRYSRVAEDARAKGDLKTAISSWQSAETEAAKTGDHETAARLALNQARTLQSLGPAAAPAEKAQRQALIITKYEAAVTGLPPAQRAFARNNLAVAYIQKGDASAAVQAMQAMEWTTVDPAQVSLCRFNFGRAQELQGDRSGALQQYRQAIEAEPDYAPAVDAAFRLLLAAENLGEVAVLAGELAERGQARSAVEHLRAALEAQPTSPQADRVIVALARALASPSVDLASYEKDIAPQLDAVAKRALGLGGLVTGMNLAISGDFPASFSNGVQARRFVAWAKVDSGQQALSKLLKNAGDFHARNTGEKSAAAALSRYAAGWALDRQNIDAALYAAAMLQGHRELDREGALLNVLIEQLFSQKGEGLAIPIKSNDDLKNIMRLHLVLAEIFEREKKWGPVADPRTATFQLAHAIAIQEQLGKTDSSVAPSPEVYGRAARAFQEASTPAHALEFYTKAAEGYLHYGATALARESVKSAAALSIPVDSSHQARLDGVTQKLRQF